MGRRSKNYILQSAIGLGFLSGLWTAIGIDPEEIVLTAIQNVVDRVYPDSMHRSPFIILPTILLLVSVRGAYWNGKIFGLISVALAYLAGLVILSAAGTGILLLPCAVGLGWLATTRRLAKKLAGLWILSL